MYDSYDILAEKIEFILNPQAAAIAAVKFLFSFTITLPHPKARSR
jgi:hypothetical protein